MNKITSINISDKPLLRRLVCYENQLTSLDVSNNKNLFMLECKSNPLECIQVNQEQLDSNINSQYWTKDDTVSYSLDCD